VLALILDQWLKFYVKLNIEYGRGFDILGLPWAKIHFVENKGMAFGLSFGGDTGKLILSLFRLIMVSFLTYMIVKMVQAKEKIGLLISFSLIIAGAFGNIIDSAIYGLIFSESRYHGGLATLFPEGGGYAGFLHGKVVDMLYFPLIDSYYPEWFPLGLGGKRFEFFRPVFNLADACISVGVAWILIFHSSFFISEKKNKAPQTAVASEKSQEEE
jgi:signal peptidase II